MDGTISGDIATLSTAGTTADSGKIASGEIAITGANSMTGVLLITGVDPMTGADLQTGDGKKSVAVRQDLRHLLNGANQPGRKNRPEWGRLSVGRVPLNSMVLRLRNNLSNTATISVRMIVTSAKVPGMVPMTGKIEDNPGTTPADQSIS